MKTPLYYFLLAIFLIALTGCETTTPPPLSETKPHTESPPQAQYPESLKGTNTEGEVIIGFTLAVNGEIKNPHVVKSTNPDFNKAAIECILKTKFVTGTINGKPIESKIRIPVTFKETID